MSRFNRQGSNVITAKTETEYDKKIQEALEKQMTDCCDGYSPYDQYGYKPRPKLPAQETPVNSESTPTPSAEPQHTSHRDASQQDEPQTDKKNSKR